LFFLYQLNIEKKQYQLKVTLKNQQSGNPEIKRDKFPKNDAKTPPNYLKH
jgi:hypothetical protein